MAEWSKALVLGTSPKGRGFESHRCQYHVFGQFVWSTFPTIGDISWTVWTASQGGDVAQW